MFDIKGWRELETGVHIKKTCVTFFLSVYFCFPPKCVAGGFIPKGPLLPSAPVVLFTLILMTPYTGNNWDNSA